MTTHEAFIQLINQRNWYQALEITREKAWSLAHQFKKGKLSLDKIEEVLKLAGFVVVVEKQWGKKIH